MYCPRCNGYGFYTITKADGSHEGRGCTHIITQPFVLLQDRELESPVIRSHSKPAD